MCLGWSTYKKQKQKKTVLIGTFYRPPSYNASVLSDIETSIDLVYDTSIKDTIVIGDFNLDLLKPNTHRKTDDICNRYSLFQLIDTPTHFTEHFSSLNDVFISGHPRNIVPSGVGEPNLC